MIEFNKTSDYLVCVDSDGTVMDTMTIKHVRCFGPKFIEVFNIKDHKDQILDYWINTNLYQKARGINRFEGLVLAIKYAFKFGYKLEGFEKLDDWVKNTPEFSETLLQAEIDKNPANPALKLAILWSKEVNKAIKTLPLTSTFKGVKETINEFYKVIDFVGVSSANKQAVFEEWERENLLDKFKVVACQDSGSKTQIIKDASLKGYDKKKIIMVGDALGDYKASLNNGVYFFPIIPKMEEYSWKKLKEEGLIKLINNQFDDQYQKEILDEFLSKLGG